MAPKMMKGAMTGAHSAGIFADMSVDGPIIGDLVVVIDRARNLPNRKSMGKQDPYCAARLGKEAKKTGTDRRGGQTPRWDQELRFTVHDSPDYYKLKVSAFNDDRKTDLIGETWVDLNLVIVRGGGQNDGWHALNCKGRPAGELRMEITYYDTREREEKPERIVPERDARQARDGESPSSQRDFRRRPLPKGPVLSDPSPNARSSQPPSQRRGLPDPRQPRHLSTDASEEGTLDPYEHRRRMMIQHGLPFDPKASRADMRRAYDGGPRPAPGQKGFTDLERLAYRNRGIQLPEAPRQEPSAAQPSRKLLAQRPISYHPPSQPISKEDDLHVREHQHSGFYDIDPDHRARHQSSNLSMQSQLQQDSSQLTHREVLASEIYRRQDELPASHEDNYISSMFPESALVESYLDSNGSVEAPPPPPPPHRSSDLQRQPSYHEISSYETQSTPSTFAQGLADLNDTDGYILPYETSTQLTVQSEPPLPPINNRPTYNHGHFPNDRRYPNHTATQQHRRSMQDLIREKNEKQFDLEEDYNLPSYHHEEPHSDSLRHVPESHLSSGSVQMYSYEARQQEIRASQPLELCEERIAHRSSAPLIKPRALSPQAVPQSQTNLPLYETPKSGQVARKSVSPSPPANRATSPGLSGVAYSPDSFDILNPQVSAPIKLSDDCSETNAHHAYQMQPSMKEPDADVNAPIRDSLGRVVDPSDHLPSSTWAPEPEPKKTIKPEVKLRFKGAVPMPVSAPRRRRPSVELPPVKSSVQSPHLVDSPSSAGSSKEKAGRNRLQKKVRIMMTVGSRMNEREQTQNGSQPDDGNSMPLKDIPNINSNHPSGNYSYHSRNRELHDMPVRFTPRVPEKIPIVAGQEENLLVTSAMHGGTTNALSMEMSNIDIGTGTKGGRLKKTRFATTLM